MRRDQLEHLLRAASTIVDEHDVVVFGSQAILATFSEDELPPEVTYSIEADVSFFDDPNDEKSDQVDGAIGELSPFHEMYGFYAQGVSITTAVLPKGWRDRVVALESEGTQPGRGLCLEAHDLVISKLVAGRQKDYEFASALLNAGLVDKATLLDRVEMLEGRGDDRKRTASWLNAQ